MERLVYRTEIFINRGDAFKLIWSAICVPKNQEAFLSLEGQTRQLVKELGRGRFITCCSFGLSWPNLIFFFFFVFFSFFFFLFFPVQLFPPLFSLSWFFNDFFLEMFLIFSSFFSWFFFLISKIFFKWVQMILAIVEIRVPMSHIV